MIEYSLDSALPILPELFCVLAGMVLLIIGAMRGNAATSVICWATVATFGVAIILLLGLDWDRVTVLNDFFVFDPFAGFMKMIVMLGLMASIAMSVNYLYQEQMVRFEYPILILFAGVGMMFMISANNMLSVYMGLELQSLSLYVLAAMQTRQLKSAESGIKYFILGALASGMLLFGISLIYGSTGTIDFHSIGQALELSEGMNAGLITGMVFVLVAIAFKISAVPFHMWTPDVYEGAPTSVTALFALVPKVAAIALLIRLLFEPFAMLVDQWQQIIWVLSLASMVVGAFAGLVQNNVKRLLAYSSIGNVGYALIGLVAASEGGVAAVILYLVIYMVMTVGAFSILLVLRRDNVGLVKLSDFAGLSSTNPVLAYSMAIIMFSMSGIPPFAGFFGKMFIFETAVAEGFYVLAVLGVLSSVVGAYYYLRIIKIMFFDSSEETIDNEFPLATRVLLVASIVIIVGFVFKPMLLLHGTLNITATFFT